MSPRPDAGGPSGRWQGHLLRNGLRVPLAVELSESGEAWRGYLSTGDNSVPLEHLRVTPTTVHFELAGEGVFEGSIAGDAMAGSILGASTSFALVRNAAGQRDPADPYWLGP